MKETSPPRVDVERETTATPSGDHSRVFPLTRHCPACQSGMVAPGIRHSAECRRLRYAFDHPGTPAMPSPDPTPTLPRTSVNEADDMEIEDEVLVPREEDFTRSFKRGPPSTAEEWEEEIRNEPETTESMVSYCLDFTFSDTGEPMASVLLSLEGHASWSFMIGPEFYDETVNSIKYYSNKDHECVKKLGGRDILIWRPDEVIDDVSLLQLDPQLGFEGMQSEIDNMEKCHTGRVIIAEEMEHLPSSAPHMRLIQSRWVGAYKTATRIVAKDIARGASARRLGISSPTPSIEALHTILALSSTRGLQIKAMDVDHAFMHSPLPPSDVVVLKLPLSVSLPDGAPAFLKLSRALNGLRDASLHWTNLLSTSIKTIGMWSGEIEPCCYQGVIQDQKGARLGVALLTFGFAVGMMVSKSWWKGESVLWYLSRSLGVSRKERMAVVHWSSSGGESQESQELMI